MPFDRRNDTSSCRQNAFWTGIGEVHDGRAEATVFAPEDVSDTLRLPSVSIPALATAAVVPKIDESGEDADKDEAMAR